MCVAVFANKDLQSALRGVRVASSESQKTKFSELFATMEILEAMRTQESNRPLRRQRTGTGVAAGSGRPSAGTDAAPRDEESSEVTQKRLNRNSARNAHEAAFRRC